MMYKYSCEPCNIHTNDKTVWNNHLKTSKHYKNTECDGKYECPECGKLYTYSSGKSRHMMEWLRIMARLQKSWNIPQIIVVNWLLHTTLKGRLITLKHKLMDPETNNFEMSRPWKEIRVYQVCSINCSLWWWCLLPRTVDSLLRFDMLLKHLFTGYWSFLVGVVSLAREVVSLL